MTILGIFLLVAVLIGVVAGKKETALLSMMFGLIYITQSQTFDVGGFNIFAFRIVEVFGFCRVLAKGELSMSGLVKVDRTFLALYAATCIIYIVRSRDGLGYAIGSALDCILSYLVFRALIDGPEQFKSFLTKLAFLLIPFVVILVYESKTRVNLFHQYEGLLQTNMAREGRLRCQGSFRHPSLMGTLGASFFPLFASLVVGRVAIKRGLLGMALCVAIVIASNSGGPLSCLMVGAIGCCLWPLRAKMRLFRWVVAGTIIVLAMVMKAPIWYLLAHVSNFTGGDGWHRSYLLDIAFQNFHKWWFAGMPILDTADWFPYEAVATGGADITNQFLAFGISAGISAMLLFIWLLVQCFTLVGQALRARTISPGYEKYMVWGLGAMLAVHISNWFGISYFDQTNMIFMLQLAALVSVCQACMKAPEDELSEATVETVGPAEPLEGYPVSEEAM